MMLTTDKWPIEEWHEIVNSGLTAGTVSSLAFPPIAIALDKLLLY